MENLQSAVSERDASYESLLRDFRELEASVLRAKNEKSALASELSHAARARDMMAEELRTKTELVRLDR